MKLLSISTSAKLPSAALLLDNGHVSMLSDESGAAHSVSLFKMIDKLLSVNRLTAADMDAFCVDVGPGSFTGVRIGVSAANALAAASERPLFAVSSLAALRHTAPRGSSNICCILNARNGNGYGAVFSDGRTTIEPCACVINEFLDAVRLKYKDITVIGDCSRDNACFADAKLVLNEAMELIDRAKAADAETVGRGNIPRICCTSNAIPLYLRPSQAERMRAKEHTN